MTQKNDALTLGIHHLGLSVRNVSETRRFFEQVLGFKLVGEKPDYPAAFVSDGKIMLTLWQVNDPEGCPPFNRKSTIGLHHFALGVKDNAALDALHSRLSVEPDVNIEFAPEQRGNGTSRHMMCAIPGGLRLELIAPEG